MFVRSCMTSLGTMTSLGSLTTPRLLSSNSSDEPPNKSGKRATPVITKGRVNLERDKVKGRVISWKKVPLDDGLSDDAGLKDFKVNFGQAESVPVKRFLAETERDESLAETRSQLLEELKSLKTLAKNQGRFLMKSDDPVKRHISDSSPDFFNVKSLFTLRDLFDNRVHLGHHMGCWHAPNKNYLYGTRNNMHIIDIASTEQHLWRALNVVSQTAFDGGTVLFVNNRAGYGHILEEAAKSCSELSYTRTKMLRDQYDKVDFSWLDKKKPDLVICSSVNNPISQQLLLHCNKYLMPSIGVVDSDVDPVNLTYVVPGNDDSTDSILLYHKLFASAIIRAKKADEVISKKAAYRKT